MSSTIAVPLPYSLGYLTSLLDGGVIDEDRPVDMDWRGPVIIERTSDAMPPVPAVGPAPVAGDEGGAPMGWTSCAVAYAPQSRKYLSFSCSNA